MPRDFVVVKVLERSIIPAGVRRASWRKEALADASAVCGRSFLTVAEPAGARGGDSAQSLALFYDEVRKLGTPPMFMADSPPHGKRPLQDTNQSQRIRIELLCGRNGGKNGSPCPDSPLAPR